MVSINANKIATVNRSTYLSKPFVKTCSIVSRLSISIPVMSQEHNSNASKFQLWMNLKHINNVQESEDLRCNNEKSQCFLFKLFFVFVFISCIVILWKKSQKRSRHFSFHIMTTFWKHIPSQQPSRQPFHILPWFLLLKPAIKTTLLTS